LYYALILCSYKIELVMASSGLLGVHSQYAAAFAATVPRQISIGLFQTWLVTSPPLAITMWSL